MWKNRLQNKKTKFFFGKQLTLEKSHKFNVEIVIPQVLDKNRLLFLNLSQHGLQIASDILLIIKE